MTLYLTRALQLALFGVLFVAFMGLSAAFPFFPSPAAVLATAGTFLTTWEIYPHLLITGYESGLGFAVAIVLGLAAGLALGTQRTVDEIFEPIILSAYAVPKIVLLPLLLMVFGVGLPAKVANAALHAVFPVLLNTVVGVRDVNTTLLKLGRSMRATRWQTFQKIVFPSMVLPVFTGLRLGLGLAVLGALLAELFESKMGLGFLVVHFYNSGEIGKMLAVILFVFVLTMAVNAVMTRTENALSRWRVAWRF